MNYDARTPGEIGKVLDDVLSRKSSETLFEMIMFGVLAGMYIGFGAIAATSVLAHGAPGDAFVKWLAASVFCVGLVLVIIPGSELFTGNVLMSAALVSGDMSFGRVLRSWFFVYIGNFIGALLLALAMYASGLLGRGGDETPTGAMAASLAAARLQMPLLDAFFRGVLCNMLVCLAVLLTIAARSVEGKILGIYFPIMVFVLSGFEHSVANMYFLPAGLLADGRLLAGFWSMWPNLLAVTFGNIIGGILVILLHPRRLRLLAARLRRGAT